MRYTDCLFAAPDDSNILVEECSAANVFVVLEDEVRTPPLKGTILEGCTRDAVLQLLTFFPEMCGVQNKKVVVGDVSLDMLQQASEVFVVGTAASVTAVGHISGWGFSENKFSVDYDCTKNNSVASFIKQLLRGMQMGEQPMQSILTSAFELKHLSCWMRDVFSPQFCAVGVDKKNPIDGFVGSGTPFEKSLPDIYAEMGWSKR